MARGVPKSPENGKSRSKNVRSLPSRPLARADRRAVQRGRIAAAYDALRRSGEALIAGEYAIKMAMAEQTVPRTLLAAALKALTDEREARLAAHRFEIAEACAARMRIELSADAAIRTNRFDRTILALPPSGEFEPKRGYPSVFRRQIKLALNRQYGLY